MSELRKTLYALDKLDTDELSQVAREALGRIHPNPETDGMHWPLMGKLIRAELDRIEFESAAREDIRTLVGGNEIVKEDDDG